MAQFVVYKNSNKATRDNFPFLLDIQSDLLDGLKTTVVIPMMSRKVASTQAITRLNPEFKIKKDKYVLVTQNMAGIDRRILGEEVMELADHRAEIIAALDFLVSGI
jgi:toxin CcdB